MNKHHLRALVSLLLTVAALLAACARLPAAPPTAAPTAELTATPTKVLAPMAKPTVTPTTTPSATTTGSEDTQMNVCHLFIAEHEERFGGMPTSVEVVYIARDGTIQQTRERTDDTILSLREGSVDASDILRSLGSFEFPPPPKKNTDPDSVVLPEHAGPTLFVEVAFCDAPSKQWVGNPEAAPATLGQLVEKAKTLAQTVPAQAIHPGERYIRAQLLAPAQVEQLRRAGLVIDINLEQLERSPLLKEAISHERRLTRVPSDEVLYGSISLSFEHGKSAHIAHDKQVFQIRHLLTAEP